MREKGILIIDYGSQYNELVARRVRELGVYSELCSFKNVEKYLDDNTLGIILTGGPKSVYASDAFPLPKIVLEKGLPILGICYGLQLLTYTLGGKVEPLENAEYGNALVTIKDSSSLLLKGIPSSFHVFMSHKDCVTRLPAGFKVTANTKYTPVAVSENKDKKIYGVQFHPEVNNTEYGKQIFKNFLFNIVKAKRNWRIKNIINTQVTEIRNRLGSEEKVLLGLSGGVDSSVTAALLSKAVGKRLHCVFVNHGLLRKNEAQEVFDTFSKMDLNFHYVDASTLFFEKLKGITSPEEKRKTIGALFIQVFNEEAKKIGKIDYLAQGTIYPDVVESGLGGNSEKIKSHHNVGGLPKDIGFKGMIEPLRYLFKDETRKLGSALGLPENIVYRQPFPGPGLGIRIIGEVTPEKVQIVQNADAIFREVVKAAHLDKKISQYYAALTNMKSVGVKGDFRSYDYAVVLRAVNTIDFMTAKPTKISYDILTEIADRIVDEVPNVNRVLFDFTSKPPATIELE